MLNASLEFLRGRLGASVYVAMTDLPDKTIPLEEPVDPEAAAAAEAEAAAAAEALGEPAEGEEAPPAEEAPAEGEPPEPPPPRVPFVPKVVVYEAATENDRKTLVGKTLARPAKPEGEEENEEAVPVRGHNEGVLFDAFDSFVKASTSSADGKLTIPDPAAPPLHLPEVLLHPSVKFWFIPRTGSLAVAPFADWEGDAKGAVCVDTVGLSTLLSEADLATISEVAAKVGASLDQVEKKLLKAHNDELVAMQADYEGTREDLAKEVEDAAALEAQAAEDPATP